MNTVIDIISRKGAVKQSIIASNNASLVVYQPSVLQIHSPVSGVDHYVRQGNDLLIYMKDGTVIRCNGYFAVDPATKEYSELVFDDGQTLTHVSFAGNSEAAGLAPATLTPQNDIITSISPFIEHAVSTAGELPWGWIVGGTLAGGAVGALLANGGSDGDSKTEVVTPPGEPQSATPSFITLDNTGDKQGLLATGDTTDDTTPTFSGTGQAGASIAIRDSNGVTVASTTVGADGRWSVSLPTQSAGEHTWSVSQIDGDQTTQAGSITLNIDTAAAAISIATTSGDNVLNGQEQAAGFTLSGATQHLAAGSTLTLTLNGKTYTTEVGSGGAWRVAIPVADAQALAEGNQNVTVSGIDAAGNRVSASQTFTVDTQPPTLSIDTLAQDNVINALEHRASLTISGVTTAQPGQTVTVTLNGVSHTAVVSNTGSWQLSISASEVQALGDGQFTVTASVTDKAGNPAQAQSSLSVDSQAPLITINTVAGDDILNGAEQNVAQIISGRANGASAGDVVTVRVGNQVLLGTVAADGSWSVGMTATVSHALGTGAHTITVSVTDSAGNTGSASRVITLSGTAPQVTVDPVSQDNVLNAQEASRPLTLSGTTSLPDGSTVSVVLNNHTYTATASGHAWSLQERCR